MSVQVPLGSLVPLGDPRPASSKSVPSAAQRGVPIPSFPGPPGCSYTRGPQHQAAFQSTARKSQSDWRCQYAAQLRQPCAGNRALEVPTAQAPRGSHDRTGAPRRLRLRRRAEEAPTAPAPLLGQHGGRMAAVTRSPPGPGPGSRPAAGPLLGLGPRPVRRGREEVAVLSPRASDGCRQVWRPSPAGNPGRADAALAGPGRRQRVRTGPELGVSSLGLRLSVFSACLPGVLKLNPVRLSSRDFLTEKYFTVGSHRSEPIRTNSCQ